MSRFLFACGALIVIIGWLMSKNTPPQPAYDATVCAGPPLVGAEARNAAMEAGYVINRELNCIDKASYEQINAERVAWEQRQVATIAGERQRLADAGASTFTQARHAFTTRVAVHDDQPLALPQPPSRLFIRSDYKNRQNVMLPGFVTPDPGDGRRHPAIVWLTGGDSNSLGDFWTRGSDSNDQSAAAFREAGLIMAFPTLRGGNGNDRAKELLMGEVDDVLAAAEQLARLSYVDPDRIYLGGHSTGGTLALLAAETKTPFKAVFAFGPVSRADRYPDSLLPIDFASLDAMELKLRSPIHWLDGIAQPTYVIEGMDGGNGDELEAICAASRNPELHCVRVRGADHFSVLRPATLIIAARLIANDNAAMLLRPEDFPR